MAVGGYSRNYKILVDGIRDMGFKILLPDGRQAPIIVTFLMPADPKFCFETFNSLLRERCYVIYPGKLTVADSFRIGCIGQIGKDEMRGAMLAIRESLKKMGVCDCAPPQSEASATT